MKKENGITLIALVITIIVLLILAGISLSLTLGENGILTKAREARIAQRDAEIEEELKMAYAGFKTAQMSKQITEKNIYKAQVDYVKTKMEERYGNKLKEVYKSGKYTKAEFKNNDTVYVLKHDGTTYHYVRMKTTNVYARLDDEGVLYLRATPGNDNNYKKYNSSDSIASNWEGKTYTSITKVIIEEPIAPKINYMFNGYANMNNIENIKYLHTENMTNMYVMFSGCNSLTSLDVSGFDTSKVTNMGHMFSECNSLTSLDLGGFDTSKATNMGNMFNGCKELTKLDISGFDASKTTDISSMFRNCNLLKNIDISNFNTELVTSMVYMFGGCTSLESINLKDINTNNVTNMNSMFYDCRSLKELDLSSFNTSNVTDTYGMNGILGNCSLLKKLNLGKNFIINEGTVNDGTKIITGNPTDIKVITTEAIATQVIKYSNLTYVNHNFEIIE